MILDLEKLIEKYDMKITGILHIGAHTGGEWDIYKKLGIDALFFEPLPESFAELKEKVGNRAKNIALGNFNGFTTMYVASNGMSSSLLEPKIHKQQYPQITFDRQIAVQVARLDDMRIHGYNMINMDVQGYELEVLAGGVRTLNEIDYIITEVNSDELYRGCARVEQVDRFLVEFERVKTDWAGFNWGDALYLRKCQAH